MSGRTRRIPFRLRFPRARLAALASASDPEDDGDLERRVAPAVRRQGFYTKAQFLAACRWKSPRALPRCARNPEGFIREVTRTALRTSDERLRIEVLRLLAGVDWPTASVLLHFGHASPYPVLDVRALWSAGHDGGSAYTFELWWHYVQFTRRLSTATGLSMRDVDRALWRYAKRHQPALSGPPGGHGRP